MLTAKACNLPVKFKYYTSGEQAKNVPGGKFPPCLETSEGTIGNTEAILRYLAGLKQYLHVGGQSAFDKAQVDLWMAMIRDDLAATRQLGLVRCGLATWTKDSLNTLEDQLCKGLERFEEHLALRTYFVGHCVTLADLYFTATMTANRSVLLTEQRMKAFPNCVRHFNYMTSTTFYQAVMGRSFGVMKNALPLADSAKVAELEAAMNAHGGKSAQQGGQAPAKGQGQGKGKGAKPAEKKAPAPKKEVDDEEEPKAPKAAPLSEEEKAAGGWFYDFKTMYANEPDKNKCVDYLFKPENATHLKYFSFWSCKYDKLAKECKEIIKTNNMMSFFFRGMDGTNKDMLAVHGIYGSETDHDIKGLYMWRGTEYHPKLKDHNTAEYYNYTKMDMSTQAAKDKLRAYWTNIKNDEGSVEGQTPLNVKVWK
jgi:elongation factor 1-gamma